MALISSRIGCRTASSAVHFATPQAGFICSKCSQMREAPPTKTCLAILALKVGSFGSYAFYRFRFFTNNSCLLKGIREFYTIHTHFDQFIPFSASSTPGKLRYNVSSMVLKFDLRFTVISRKSRLSPNLCNSSHDHACSSKSAPTCHLLLAATFHAIRLSRMCINRGRGT